VARECHAGGNLDPVPDEFAHPGHRRRLADPRAVAGVAAPERILTRNQLLEAIHVYDNEVYDRAIDIQVLRLRRKIENDPAQPRFIVTERGAGYVPERPSAANSALLAGVLNLAGNLDQ